jgi:hypothetical protein
MAVQLQLAMDGWYLPHIGVVLRHVFATSSSHLGQLSWFLIDEESFPTESRKVIAVALDMGASRNIEVDPCLLPNDGIQVSETMLLEQH